ncbi:extracellular serine-rich protein [Diaporthe sp. PMI_573]|nr:extracellular serine-rich protein [Diaporthaceae sp. PMI_573]
MFRRAVFAILGATVIVSAGPSLTAVSSPSKTATTTGVTHSVLAGLGGALVFDPENVVAEIGDVVEWHFLPKNHSVAQSSFANPCVPQSSVTPPFFSGFFPVDQGEADNVFQIVVKDKRPIWYYCAQTTGNHWQSGMAGVINQHFDSSDTLAAYKAKAAETNSSIVPSEIQGGAKESDYRSR